VIDAGVMEIDEIDPELLSKTKKGTTTLIYNAGNISQYFMSLDTIEETQSYLSEMYHLTPIRQTYLNPKTGLMVEPRPEDRNALLLQLFAGDGLNFTKNAAALMVQREEEFARVMSRADVPVAVALLSRQHQRLIEASGGSFLPTETGDQFADGRVEISPLASVGGEDLSAMVRQDMRRPLLINSRVETGAAPRKIGQADSDRTRIATLYGHERDTLPVVSALHVAERNMALGNCARMEPAYQDQMLDSNNAFEEDDEEKFEFPPTPDQVVAERLAIAERLWMSSQGADPDDILEQIRQREAEEQHNKDVAEKKRQRHADAMRADNRKSKKNTKKKTAVDPKEEE
jgi:hypothetical protein